ncbi:apolipoprotein C-II [Pyxicephalus adspersus]|uniref:apolipoprotein C-II n=1 Tax=Pyxicephalus adspersus TaxID=30357 RepID=UPI003B5CD76C
MRLTQVLAVSFLVVLLCSGIESYRIQRAAEEDDNLMSKAQGYFNSVINSLSFAAEGVYEKIKEIGVPTKIKEIYDQGAEKVTIYTGILSDQLYHWTGSN